MSDALPVMKVIKPDYSAAPDTWRTRVFLDDVEVRGIIGVASEFEVGAKIRVILTIDVESVEVQS